MEPRFEVSFIADEQLFREFGETHAAGNKRPRLLIVCGFLLLICSGLLFLLTVQTGDGISSFAVFTLLMGLFAVVYGLFYGRILGTNSYKISDRTFAGQPVVCRFDDAYFYTMTRLQTATVRYEGIVEVAESDRLFILYTGKGTGHILPKSGFALGTPEQFREFIAAHTGRPVQTISMRKSARNRTLCLIAAAAVLATDMAGPLLYAGYLRRAPSTLTVDNYSITVAGRFDENPESAYDLEAYRDQEIYVLACYYTQEDMAYYCGEQDSTEDYLRAFTASIEGIRQVEYGILPGGAPYCAYYWSDENGVSYFYINSFRADLGRGGYWLTELCCVGEERSQYEDTFLAWADSVRIS